MLVCIFIGISNWCLFTVSVHAYICIDGALWQTIYMMLIDYIICNRLSVLVNECMPDTTATTVTNGI